MSLFAHDANQMCSDLLVAYSNTGNVQAFGGPRDAGAARRSPGSHPAYRERCSSRYYSQNTNPIHIFYCNRKR